jgi:hypothetical protein
VGSAVKSLKGLGDGAVGEVEVDASVDPHATGEFIHSLLHRLY